MEILTKEKSKDILEIEERLKSNSLAYKIIVDKKVNTEVLLDGSAKMVGISEINKYLDKLEGEKQQWHFCNC